MSRLPNWVYDALDAHGVEVGQLTRDSFDPIERRQRRYVFCGFVYRRKVGRVYVDPQKGPFRTESAAMVDAALHYRLMNEDGSPTKNAQSQNVVQLRGRAA